MKKALLFLMLISCTSTLVNAQFKHCIGIGVGHAFSLKDGKTDDKFGYTESRDPSTGVVSKNDAPSKLIEGGVYSIYYQLKFSNNWFLQSDFSYFQGTEWRRLNYVIGLFPSWTTTEAKSWSLGTGMGYVLFNSPYEKGRFLSNSNLRILIGLRLYTSIVKWEEESDVADKTKPNYFFASKEFRKGIGTGIYAGIQYHLPISETFAFNFNLKPELAFYFPKEHRVTARADSHGMDNTIQSNKLNEVRIPYHHIYLGLSIEYTLTR